jgi:hypothetical protein
MREQMTHPDTGVLAEFRAGLITGRHGARISAHLAACSHCAGLAGDLAELPALLAAVPAPVMPGAVAQRLEAVLAAAAADRDSSERATVPASPGRERSPRPRRHWDFRLVARRVLAPAAAVAALAGGGYGLSRIAASPASSVAAGSAAASAASSRVAGAAAAEPSSAASNHRGAVPAAESPLTFEVVTSRINYQQATLRQQLAAELQRQAKASAGAQEFADTTIKGCVLAVTTHVPLLVETARFQGRPAIVIVVRTGDHDVAWLTTPSCSGPGRHVLATTTLQGTSAP